MDRHPAPLKESLFLFLGPEGSEAASRDDKWPGRWTAFVRAIKAESQKTVQNSKDQHAPLGKSVESAMEHVLQKD